MANEQNLIRLSPSKAREYGSKGGKASGEARRRKADFRKLLNQLLTTEIDHPEWTPILEGMGLESTLGMALNAAMIREGLAGNVKAYEAIAKYAGQSGQTEADDEEQRIRTDRARQARSQELGETDSGEENIKSFLKAMNPTPEDLDSLWEKENDNDAEEAEETGEI